MKICNSGCTVDCNSSAKIPAHTLSFWGYWIRTRYVIFDYIEASEQNLDSLLKLSLHKTLFYVYSLHKEFFQFYYIKNIFDTFCNIELLVPISTTTLLLDIVSTTFNSLYLFALFLLYFHSLLFCVIFCNHVHTQSIFEERFSESLFY